MLSQWKWSCKDSAPPEVKPQPQESFHIFNSCTLSSMRLLLFQLSDLPGLSFFLPLMFLSTIPVQGGGVQDQGQSDTRLAPGLIACFRQSMKSKRNKPLRSSTLRRSHLHARPSILPVLLCNVNGWLLFPLITSSRCVFVWSLSTVQAGLAFWRHKAGWVQHSAPSDKAQHAITAQIGVFTQLLSDFSPENEMFLFSRPLTSGWSPPSWRKRKGHDSLWDF